MWTAFTIDLRAAGRLLASRDEARVARVEQELGERSRYRHELRPLVMSGQASSGAAAGYLLRDVCARYGWQHVSNAWSPTRSSHRDEVNRALAAAGFGAVDTGFRAALPFAFPRPDDAPLISWVPREETRARGRELLRAVKALDAEPEAQEAVFAVRLWLSHAEHTGVELVTFWY